MKGPSKYFQRNNPTKEVNEPVDEEVSEDELGEEENGGELDLRVLLADHYTNSVSPEPKTSAAFEEDVKYENESWEDTEYFKQKNKNTKITYGRYFKEFDNFLEKLKGYYTKVLWNGNIIKL